MRRRVAIGIIGWLAWPVCAGAQAPQQGPPLNYFIYPYVEVDGQLFDHVDHRFRFEDVLSTSEGETALNSS